MAAALKRLLWLAVGVAIPVTVWAFSLPWWLHWWALVVD